MDFQIVGPFDEIGHDDTFDIWIANPCIARGKTKIDAITAAQRALNLMSRHLSEMVWQEYRRLEAPCFTNQSPTER